MGKKMNKEEKIELMKKIIIKADESNNFEWAKKEFAKLLKNTNADEISQMEQNLISQGYPVEKIQNLCDLHVSVFESSLKKKTSLKKMPGHPIHTFILENKELKKRLKLILSDLKNLKRKNYKDISLFNKIKNEFEDLKLFEKHYLRKENQLFPYLEKKGFTGPSKVMWAKDDEIRVQIKQISQIFDNIQDIKENEINQQEYIALIEKLKKLASDMNAMIFKEEKILFPASHRKISEEEWLRIKDGESAIGYSWVIPGSLWDAYALRKIKKDLKNKYDKNYENNQVSTIDQINQRERINLDVGILTLNQLNLMLSNLPVDISFIDENDKVAFYSNNAERIFPRSPAVIGREVQNCHPPKSVHLVNKILENFKKGVKDHADFWIDLNGRLIYIRYFAVRDKYGKYLGTLEVSQDITEIKKLEGEKRLLDF